MPEPELSLLFVRPLNQIGARYIVSGSVASILYGEPRLTNDVDFVIFFATRTSFACGKFSHRRNFTFRRRK